MTLTPSHPSPEQDELREILRKVTSYSGVMPERLDKGEAAIRTWALKVSLECVGDGWHHNSEAWCAGANARRDDTIKALTTAFGQEENK